MTPAELEMMRIQDLIVATSSGNIETQRAWLQRQSELVTLNKVCGVGCPAAVHVKLHFG